MGCAGFLGPQKLNMEVYANLIIQIHAEAPKIANIDHQNNPQDLIQAINQRLTRKGYLRKLNDYLASHHNKIYESLILNYKEMDRHRQLLNRLIGIAVVDSIIETVYKKLARNTQQSLLRNNNLDESVQVSKGESQTFDFKRSIIRNRKMSINLHSPIQYSYDPRIDDQYFKTINYLLDNENCMYQRILISLQNFCTQNPNKILNEQQAWKSISRIVEYLEQGFRVALSCNVFYMLLSKCKEHVTQEMKTHHYLRDILNIWLQAKEKEDMLYQSCLGILTIYINRCMGSSQFVYQVILQVYESLKFEHTQLIEQLCEKAVQNLDLKSQFLRGLWNHLLSYLSVNQFREESERQSFSMSLKNSEHHNRIHSHSAKIQGFRTLNSWISKDYIDIDEVVTYSSKSLIVAYSSNICLMHTIEMNRFQSLLIDQFFKMVSKMSESSKHTFKRQIIEEFKEQNSEQMQQSALLRLLKEILYRSRSQHHSSSDISSYFIPLQLEYDNSIKFDLIRLVGFVVQNTEDKLAFENETGIYAVCEFMCSLYANLVSVGPCLNLNAQERYHLVCAIVSFVKILVGKSDRALLISYIEHINQHKTVHRFRISDQIEFFINVLEYELSHILFKAIKVPEKMFKILQTVPTGTPTHLLQTHITAYMHQQRKNLFNIQHLTSSLTNYNQQYYEQIKVIFKQYFMKVGKEGREGSEIMESQIVRKSRISKRSSIRSDSYDVTQCDKSFKEIINIIK